MDPPMESLASWYRGRNIFITGGTGFMGKVLIHKLLLSCPDLGKIFVLIREKKGIDSKARMSILLQQEPFNALGEKYPERLQKVEAITGDTTLEKLGLSEYDREKLIQNVSVIFHVAANVRFDMPLKDAVKINVEGTVNVVELAKKMKRLEAFIHVSTTYCQCHEKVLEERAYPVPISPENVIITVNKLSSDVVDAMTPKILGNQPNTYAFTKALSEDVIQNSGLIAGVLRPSIVTASLKEPYPGWVDNLHGATGLMIGAGKGVIRSYLCNHKSHMTVIPCDIAINAAISLARKVGRDKPTTPIFINATNSTQNSISWGEAIEVGKKFALENPFSGILWYPGGSVTTWWFYHQLRVILVHYFPAYFIDALAVLTGNKPFLVKVQNRVKVGVDLLQYYTTKDWNFRDEGLKRLETELTPSDRETFYLNTKDLRWNDYILSYLLGARKYCLKDDPSTLPRARRVMTYYYYADWILKIFLFSLFAWAIYSFCTIPLGEETGTVVQHPEI